VETATLGSGRATTKMERAHSTGSTAEGCALVFRLAHLEAQRCASVCARARLLACDCFSVAIFILASVQIGRELATKCRALARCIAAMEDV
jgi:hypothetical protein